jgi:hypothetical protein
METIYGILQSKLVAITPTEKLANILKEHENMKKVRRTIVAKQTQEKYTVSGKSMK